MNWNYFFGFLFCIGAPLAMAWGVRKATELNPSDFIRPMRNKHILRLCSKHMPLRLSRVALLSERHCDVCWERALKNIDRR